MKTSFKFTRRTVVVVITVVLTLVIPTVPAFATHAYWEFVKGTNRDSTLKWYSRNSNEVRTLMASWRAGSGVSTDPCAIGRGWLPDGWYDSWGHWNQYNGNAIDGRVFWLQNKTCRDGTTRTELFIHSEQTVMNGQDCPTSGDDPQCWEAYYDYESAGCIKVAYPNNGFPDTIGSVHYYFHNLAGSRPTNQHDQWTMSAMLYVD